MKKIIVLVGPIGSGKDVTKKYIENKYGARSIRFSDSFRSVCDRLDIEISRENLIKMSTLLRENFGQDLLSKVVAKDVNEIDHDLVILDGARRHSDVVYVREIEGFVLISIGSSPEIRFERIIQRDENKGDSGKTFEEFVNDEKKESEITIPKLMGDAKFHIDNNGTFEDLYKQIDEIMDKL